jgi:hypothetical protein
MQKPSEPRTPEGVSVRVPSVRPNLAEAVKILALGYVAVLCMLMIGTSSAGAVSWTVQRLPTPNKSAQLSAVSCPSPSMCMAVGAVWNGGPLIERWNGKRWTDQRFPRMHGSLSAVSCPSVRDCVAVGDWLLDGGYHQVVLRWNGRNWSPQGGPALDAISCTSASFCMGVVGSGDPDGGNDFTAARWNGQTWAVSQPQTNPVATGTELLGISCASSSDCMAVGDQVFESSCLCSLTEHWNGTSWSATMNPFQGTVNGISCPSPAACTAVAGYSGPPVLGHWNGRTWSTPRTPAPWSDLTGVSCPSPSACLVAGFSGAGGVVVGMWNRSRWSTVGVLHLRRLAGVSCRMGLMCVVVGRDARGLVALRTTRPLAPAPGPHR